MKFEQLLQAAEAGHAHVSPETVAFAILSIAECLTEGEEISELHPEKLVLNPGGTWESETGNRVSSSVATGVLRSLLRRSLTASRGESIRLDKVVALSWKEPKAFADAIRDALIPFNRSAAKRALIRWSREAECEEPSNRSFERVERAERAERAEPKRAQVASSLEAKDEPVSSSAVHDSRLGSSTPVQFISNDLALAPELVAIDEPVLDLPIVVEIAAQQTQVDPVLLNEREQSFSLAASREKVPTLLAEQIFTCSELSYHENSCVQLELEEITMAIDVLEEDIEPLELSSAKGTAALTEVSTKLNSLSFTTVLLAKGESTAPLDLGYWQATIPPSLVEALPEEAATNLVDAEGFELVEVQEGTWLGPWLLAEGSEFSPAEPRKEQLDPSELFTTDMREIAELSTRLEVDAELASVAQAVLNPEEIYTTDLRMITETSEEAISSEDEPAIEEELGLIDASISVKAVIVGVSVGESPEADTVEDVPSSSEGMVDISANSNGIADEERHIVARAAIAGDVVSAETVLADELFEAEVVKNTIEEARSVESADNVPASEVKLEEVQPSADAVAVIPAEPVAGEPLLAPLEGVSRRKKRARDWARQFETATTWNDEEIGENLRAAVGIEA